MFIYTIKIAMRRLWKNRLFSFINFIGLVLGFVSTFWIVSYLFYEKNYDRQNPDNELSYRLISEDKVAKLSDRSLSAYNFLPVMNIIDGKITGVDDIVRIQPLNTATLKSGNETYIEKDFIWADSNITKIINLHFIKGVAEKSLTEPNSVVISKSEATRLFGNQDALGKVFIVDGNTLKVTGVFEDMPANNTLQKNMIASIYTLKHLDDPWSHQGYIYLKLKRGYDPKLIAGNINSVTKGNLWWLRNAPQYSLQSTRNIHLHSDNIVGTPNAVNIKYLYIFGFIAILLVFCTIFNYISLALADFTQRTKEFGIKNILGSGKKALVLQPLTECFLLYLISVSVSLLISVSILPYVNNLFQTEIDQSFFYSLPNMAILSLVVLFTFLFSSLYPLLLVARTNAIDAFHKTISLWKMHLSIRRPLMVMQFTIAIALVFGVIVIRKQMYLLGKENLGFTKEQVVILKSPKFNEVNKGLIKQKLKNIAGISNVSVAIGTPFSGGLTITMGKEEAPYNVSIFNTDQDYVKTLGMTIEEGEDLTENDTNHVIVNEAMVQTMGWKNPLGQKIDVLGKSKKVKAVVRNFQMSNIHIAPNPALIDIGNEYLSLMLVRLQTKNISGTLNAIQKVWKEAAPGSPMEYSFLDQEYQKLYVSEIRAQKLGSLFSIIAIIIACLGLYGSVMHIIRERVKEIGIRKVLGASASKIVAMLSIDLIRLLLISFTIAIPIAWYAMNQWLEDFASRIEMKWWMVVIAGFIVAAISIFTISYQAIKAAIANPVKSLRSE